MIPVNPRAVGKEILGEPVYGDLAKIPVPVDMVDIFRASHAAGAFADQAAEIGAKVVWMQLEVTTPPPPAPRRPAESGHGPLSEDRV